MLPNQYKVSTKRLEYFGNHIFLELYGNECIVLHTIEKHVLFALQY